MNNTTLKPTRLMQIVLLSAFMILILSINSYAVAKSDVYAKDNVIYYNFEIDGVSPADNYMVYFLLDDAKIKCKGSTSRDTLPQSCHTIKSGGLTHSYDISNPIKNPGVYFEPEYLTAGLRWAPVADEVLWSYKYSKDGKFTADVTIIGPNENITGLAFVRHERHSAANNYYYMIGTQQNISEYVAAALRKNDTYDGSQSGLTDESFPDSKTQSDKESSPADEVHNKISDAQKIHSDSNIPNTPPSCKR